MTDDREPILLRDGASAWVRAAVPADAHAIAALPWTAARRDDVARLAAVSVVTRDAPGGEAILGAAGYLAAAVGACDAAGPVARAMFAVRADELGRGIGTLLLQHVAERAHAAGIAALTAVAASDDARAQDVLRSSGLVIAEEATPGGLAFTITTNPDAHGLARFDERERAATAASLVPLFRPRSVAVVGASRTPGAIGRVVLDRLVAGGFAGPVYPVNPSALSIGAIRAYPSVDAIPDPVDLAVIAVPPSAVPAAVDACATHGVRALIVLTAGFAETGDPGRAAQAALVARVRGHGMRMVGPNCLGVFNTNPAVRLNATFGRGLPPRGGVAMSSQSGAMGLAIADYATRLGIGLSSFVSVGNKADVSGNDLLQYWEADPDTNVIALYLESFGNPRKFARIARRVGRTKPILAVKSGRSAAGSRAARSHTAALAGSDVAADALFRQAGIIRLDTLEELFDVASLLTNQPPPRGPRVAVITNAGGPGILCADACEANGLTLPSLAGATTDALRVALPPTAGLGNPVDMIASATPAQYETVARTVLADDAVDALIAIYIPVSGGPADDYARALHRGVAQAPGGVGAKPVLACFMSPDDAPGPLRGATDDPRPIPAYRFPEAPARALGHAVRYEEWRRRDPGVVRVPTGVDAAAARAAIDDARAATGASPWLAPDRVARLLGAAGLALPSFRIAPTPEAAAEAAVAVGFPVAVKVVSTAIVHKSDVGGVALALADAAAVRSACERMAGLEGVSGYLVQRMVPGGIEVMVGVTVDPTFGPLVGFGLGGTTVEVLRDVAFRLTPLTDVDAAEQVRAIRGFPLLDGYRGAPPADVAAVEDLLLRTAWLTGVAPEIAEMDLNPVRVFPRGNGLAIVDARIAIARGDGG